MTRKELSDLHEEAMQYCFRRLQHMRIRRRVWERALAMGEYPAIFYEWINVPGVGRSACEYRFVTRPKINSEFIINVHLCQDGIIYMVTDRLYTGLKGGGIRKDRGKYFLAICPHAIDRYIERHKFEGTYSEAELHIVSTYRHVTYKQDMVTGEIICPFEDGAFLGYQDKDGIATVKTFVMHRQLYDNQRLEDYKARQFMEQCFNESNK